MNPTNVIYQVYQIMHEFILKKSNKQDTAKTVSDNFFLATDAENFTFVFLSSE